MLRAWNISPGEVCSNCLMNSYIRIFVCALGFLSISNATRAEDPSFWQDKQRGWFWREEQPEQKKPEKKKVEPPLPSSSSAKPSPDVFSVDWFKENMNKLRDRAIDNPTKENVLAYLSAQRVMHDKATVFSEKYQEGVKSAPWLDENVRSPATMFGANAASRLAEDATKRYMPQVAKVAGIWFFYRSDCQFCQQELPLLVSLARQYGFSILPISLDGLPLPNSPFPKWVPDRGQAARLNVTVTPSLFLVRPPQDIVPLAYGLTPLDEIMTRAIDVASQSGWIAPNAQREIRISDTKSQVVNLMKTVPKSSSDDPKALVEAVRKAIQGK